MQVITSTRLMDLKSTLQIMVDKNLMEESEMINVLNKAGLSRLPEGEGWIDSNGHTYTFQK